LKKKPKQTDPHTELTNHHKPNDLSKKIKKIEKHQASKNTMNTTNRFGISLFSSQICQRILFEGVFKDSGLGRNFM
jgi:hypothetical protein